MTNNGETIMPNNVKKWLLFDVKYSTLALPKVKEVGTMNYRDITKTDMELQKKLLKAYRVTLASLPEGRLSAKRVRGSIHYYHVDEKTRKQTYIPKSRIDLIHQLKQKRYIKKAIKIMEENLRLQEAVMKKYKAYDQRSLQKMMPLSDSDDLLDEFEQKYFPDLHKWAEGPYRKNPYYPEHLRHTTSFGLKVRSKSEMSIAELLHAMGIPFRYDAEIKVRDKYYNKKVRYVDFLIKLPDGSYIVWEHMGLFKKESYRAENFEKITEYFMDGIFMPNNLIITMDGPNDEFDNLAVERIIKGQILPHFKR